MPVHVYLLCLCAGKFMDLQLNIQKASVYTFSYPLASVVLISYCTVSERTGADVMGNILLLMTVLSR